MLRIVTLFDVFVLLEIFLSFNAVLGLQTMFNGSQYIAYPMHNEGGSIGDRIVLDFKTSEPYGVLLYSGGTQKDFVAVEIIRGKLSYSADLGSTSEESGFHQVVIGENVADNKWHHVEIIQDLKKVDVILDKQKKSMVAPGLFSRLDLNVFLYAGGIDKVAQRKHHAWVPDTHNFKGCLANVVFRSKDILHSAKYELLKTVTHGGVSFKCVDQVYSPMSFVNSNSKILFNRGHTTVDTSLSLTFRTFEGSGMIATMATAKGHVTLANVNGKSMLNMTFSNMIGPERKISISAGKIADGDWHKVVIRVEKATNSMILTVNEEEKVYKFARHFELAQELGPFKKTVKIGGPSISHPGFVGCVRNLTIDGKAVVLKTLKPHQFTGITNKCSHKDLCFPSPCLNSGNCTQDHGEFKCKCPKSLFKGKNCETSIYKRTCDEINKSGQTKSGLYRISPNGIDSFEVYCKMDHVLGAATVIHHSLRADTLAAGTVPKSGFYRHEIHYKLKLGKISAIEVADASTKCRQLLQYDCYQSKLLDSLRRYETEHIRGGRWFSRHGVIQTYWGGATPGSKVCACGMPGRRNCADRHLDCNCDLGDEEWRKDAGYLTDKDSLPITSVQFNAKQQQHDQRSFFTVGALECFGTAPLPTTTPPPTTTTTIATTIKTTAATSAKPTKKKLKRPAVSEKVVDNYPTLTTAKVYNNSVNASQEAAPLNGQEDLFPRPYLITIVVIGTVLCILLITLVGMLFKAKVSGILFRKSCPPKPRVEIEEYDQRSSVISSDWEFRIGTSFPTSTPDESTTTSEEDMRVRTLEDIRGRRRYGRLGTWGSRTASAPTLGGRMRNSRVNMNDRRSASRHSGLFSREGLTSGIIDDASSQPYETSSDSSKYTMKSTTNTSNSNSSRFSTCTEPGTVSDCESVKTTQEDSTDQLSRGKQDKELEQRVNLPQPTSNGSAIEAKASGSNFSTQKPAEFRQNGNASIPDSYMRINGCSVPYANSNNNQEGSRLVYPPVQINNYSQRPHIRRIPQPLTHSEYGTHLQLINPTSRCYYPSQANRFVPIGKRPYGSDAMPFLQQTIQEVDVPEEEPDVETNLMEDEIMSRRSNGHAHTNGFRHHDSGNNFDEENQEGLALLKKKIIEKATSLDDELDV